MTIREATFADFPGIAKVHVDTWRTTYRGIVPDDYLDALSYGDKEQMWTRALSTSNGGPPHVYVAEDDQSRVLGFVSAGPTWSDDPDYEGEVYAIYVLRDHQGKGIGRQLFRAAVQRLADSGIRSVILWVLTDNPSRRFYEAIGGRYLYPKQQNIGGVCSMKLRMVGLIRVTCSETYMELTLFSILC